MGNADVTTRRLFDKIDMEQTYPNSLTSRDINGFRIPIVMENDDLAIRFALHTITGANAASGYRAMWIRDTNHVQTFYVTERLLADTAAMPWLRTDGVRCARSSARTATLPAGREPDQYRHGTTRRGS